MSGHEGVRAELELLIEHAPVCVHRVDRDGRVTSINGAGLCMLGVSAEDVLGQPYLAAVSAAERERVGRDLVAALAGEHRKFTFHSTDGKAFSSSFLPVRDSAGTVTHLVGITQDESPMERLTAEAMLSARRVADIAHTIDGVVWEADAETFAFTQVSEGAERLLGYPAAAWLESPTFWVDHLHADDRDATVRQCQAAARRVHDHELEYRLVAADGSSVWVNDRVTVVGTGGKPRVLRGVMIDITRRKDAEAAMRRQESMLRLILEGMPLGVLVTDDRTGATVHFNRRFIELWGLEDLEPGLHAGTVSASQVVAHVSNLFADQEAFLETVARLRDPTSIGVVEDDLQLKDGRRIRRVSAHLGGAHGMSGARILSFEDVTEQRRMGERLVETERLGALGTLAAGIAHEINNPLAYVVVNLDYLRVELARRRERGEAGVDDALEQALADAQEGTERVRRIVHDLKVFSRKPDDTQDVTDVHAAMAFALRLTANERQFRARLETDLAPVAPIRGTESRLTQVFVNLLSNAVQAFDTANRAANLIRVRTRTDDAGLVVVEVTDTGRGMSREFIRRVFEPYYSAGHVGATPGLGLGLSLCHGIVTRLGGQISVDSEPGKGTTVRLRFLPAVGAQRRVGPPSRAASRARILVIDDEEVLLRALERWLSRSFDVATCSSAEVALGLIRDGQVFDVVLCDIMLAGMSGMVFEGELTLRHPEVRRRLIFMTGGALTSEARAFIDSPSRVTLDKPLDFGALANAVSSILESHGPAY